MKLSQATQRANAGDMKCMVALADYYGGEQDFDTSMFWYDKAIECGNLYAAYQQMSLCFIKALQEVDANAWDAAETHICKMWDLGALLLKQKSIMVLQLSSGQRILTEVAQKMDDAQYWKAVIFYWHKEDYASSAELCFKKDTPRFLVLKALTSRAMVDHLSDDAPEDLFEKGCKVVLEASNTVAQSDYTPKNGMEAVLYALAAVNYSEFYRTGYLVEKPDNLAAYKILTAAKSKTTDDTAKGTIDTALRHYQYKRDFRGEHCTFTK